MSASGSSSFVIRPTSKPVFEIALISAFVVFGIALICLLIGAIATAFNWSSGDSLSLALKESFIAALKPIGIVAGLALGWNGLRWLGYRFVKNDEVSVTPSGISIVKWKEEPKALEWADIDAIYFANNMLHIQHQQFCKTIDFGYCNRDDIVPLVTMWGAHRFANTDPSKARADYQLLELGKLMRMFSECDESFTKDIEEVIQECTDEHALELLQHPNGGRFETTIVDRAHAMLSEPVGSWDDGTIGYVELTMEKGVYGDDSVSVAVSDLKRVQAEEFEDLKRQAYVRD